ncbi:c-type cytochrome biogenesis protein CcmI [Falsihalocynthiibacter sp. CO-5D18]|uniref:c-type cytochrome biogenesis protein CcmI n=1 Tax=Falsihalocynthiibacter sp. CO-5D18 TaxID=3240872 RepID=UPI0035104016
MIYFLGSFLIVMVLFAFVVPIIKNRQGMVSHADSAQAMWQDQLDEVNRDVKRELISAEDGRSATVEIQRRIIATHREQPPASNSEKSGAWAMISAAIFVPVAATVLYLNIGSPTIPSIVFADRSEEQEVVAKQEDLKQRLLLQLESEENGGSTEGWLLLANAYMGMKQYAQAVDAYSRILERDEATFLEFALFAEASILRENGIVSPTAEKALDRSMQMSPGNVVGIYYKSVALAQAGQIDAAFSLLTSRLATAEGLFDWMDSFVAQANFYGAKLGRAPISLSDYAPILRGPTAEDIDRTSDMSVEDRNAFILSMVERLRARLEDEPNDLDGWLMLARAFTVLGDQQQALRAYRHSEPLVAPLPDGDQRKILVNRKLLIAE